MCVAKIKNFWLDARCPQQAKYGNKYNH